jgi:hypothetical protein
VISLFGCVIAVVKHLRLENKMAYDTWIEQLNKFREASQDNTFKLEQPHKTITVKPANGIDKTIEILTEAGKSKTRIFIDKEEAHFLYECFMKLWQDF